MESDRMAEPVKMEGTAAEKGPLAEVFRFASTLPLQGREQNTHDSQIRRWTDIPIDQLRDEMLHRNGRFQNLLNWMRHSWQANAVLDASGRVLYLNQAAEHYFQVHLWEVQGRNLCQIMNLSESETVRDQRERQRIVDEGRADVLQEAFQKAGEHLSVLYFPYGDDHGDMLLGAFILPLVATAPKHSRGYEHRPEY
jgi:PAS domain-containing protein